MLVGHFERGLNKFGFIYNELDIVELKEELKYKDSRSVLYATKF